MSRKLIALCLVCMMWVPGWAQLDCDRNSEINCNAQTIGGGICFLDVYFYQCNGSPGSLNTYCYPTECYIPCYCDCGPFGGTISYYDTCGGGWTVLDYTCSGCN